jgi:hypothetical protein
MILLIVILLTVWIILTLLIVSLCFVARLGDLQQSQSDPPGRAEPYCSTRNDRPALSRASGHR